MNAFALSMIVVVILITNDLLLLYVWKNIYNNPDFPKKFTSKVKRLFSPSQSEITDSKLKKVLVNVRVFLKGFAGLFKVILFLNEEIPENEEEAVKIKKSNFIRNIVIDVLLMMGFFFFAYRGQKLYQNYIIGEIPGTKSYLYASIFMFILVLRKRLVIRPQKKEGKAKTTPKLTMRKFKFSRLLEYIKHNKRRTALLFVSIIATVLSTVLLVNRSLEEPFWDIFVIWIISWSSFMLAFIQWPKIQLKAYLKDHYVDILSILFFTIVGIGLRFYALGDLPNIMNGDEGVVANNALDVVNGEVKNIFGTSIGNSNIYLLINGIFLKLFGINLMSIRIFAAVAGVLAIPILYIFANDLFNRRIAWISTALLTTSHFHIHFSRIMSCTSIHDVYFATLCLYLLYTGLKKNSLNRMVIGGTALGFFIYIYMGARLIILLVPIYLFFLYFAKREMVTSNIKNLIIYWIALFIIIIPMMQWAITQPHLFNTRIDSMGIFQSGWLEYETTRTGISSIGLIFLALKRAYFSVIYYHSFGFHMSNKPMLDFITCAFFVAGSIYSLVYTQKPKYLLLNGWFWAGLLVGGALVIAPQDNSYRILIVFPVICLFVAIAFDKLLSYIEFNKVIKKYIRPALTVGFILTFAFLNLKEYYVDYLPSCRFEGHGTRLASFVAEYTVDLGPEYTPVLVTHPVLEQFTHESMSFLTQNREFLVYIDPLDDSFSAIDKDIPYVFYVIPERADDLAVIRRTLPGGKIDHIVDCGVEITTVYVWNPE